MVVLMAKSEDQTRKIVRERTLRQTGDSSSAITIPPVVREFTEFETGQDVEISAGVGDDEIRIRVIDDDEQTEE